MAAVPGRCKYCFIYILVPNLTPSYVSREAGHGMFSIIPTQKRQLHAREAFKKIKQCGYNLQEGVRTPPKKVLNFHTFLLFMGHCGCYMSGYCQHFFFLGGGKKRGLKPHFFLEGFPCMKADGENDVTIMLLYTQKEIPWRWGIVRWSHVS